ncbi:MAG: alpha/beta hydrolase [Acidobacteriaceae bacterium]|nr:alpha/beta hydrolase [Acidobacteriaceae bacterium]MBV9781037.1 alpha/beta hydrolase [Acidobacteriaceae bacterium]
MPARLWAVVFAICVSMAVQFSAAQAASNHLGSSLASRTPQGTRLINDIEYGQVRGISLRMDASIPAGPGKFPAVIIVHGGGWVTGDRRSNVEPLFRPLSNAGFAWFSISYRLATDLTHFGSAINDVEQAVRFIKSNASDYHVDPQRIALLGESAGGQLAAMAALHRDPDTSVKAVVALYAPSDLVSLARSSEYIPSSIRDSIRGTPWEGLVLAGLAQLSPINSVRSDMPPFLLIHGTADALIPFEQSKEMCARMREAGASCELYPVEGGGHGIRWWESFPKLAAGYKEKLVTWLGRTLGSGGSVAPLPQRLAGS